MTRRRRRAVVIALFILSITLIGCTDVNVTVDFFPHERWEADLEVIVPGDTLLRVATEQQVENQLSALAEQAEAYGVRVQRSRSSRQGDVVYLMEMEGKGLYSLSQLAFGGNAEIYVEELGGQRQIHFGQLINPELDFNSLSITLRGGNILSHNGYLIDQHTVTWRDPYGWIEATLTEHPPDWVSLLIELGPYIVGILGLLIAFGLLRGLWRIWRRKRSPKRKRCPQCQFLLPKGSRHCPGCGHDLQAITCRHCGFAMPADAVFCPQCGREKVGFVGRVHRRFLHHRARIQSSKAEKKAEELTPTLQEEPASQSVAVSGGPNASPVTGSSPPVPEDVTVPEAGEQSSLEPPLISTPVGDGLLLGSSDENDIRLDDPAVSAQHAAIRAARTCYFIEDLGSEGGTLVNDQYILGAKRLSDGDMIRIGSVSFVFTDESLIRSDVER